MVCVNRTMTALILYHTRPLTKCRKAATAMTVMTRHTSAAKTAALPFYKVAKITASKYDRTYQ